MNEYNVVQPVPQPINLYNSSIYSKSSLYLIKFLFWDKVQIWEQKLQLQQADHCKIIVKSYCFC